MTTGARPVDWPSIATSDVAPVASTDVTTGLSSDEAKRRLAAHGPNAIREERRRGPLRMVLSQFADVTVLVLIGAAVVSAVVGETADIVAILVIVVLNAALGAVQEYRAENAIAALRQLAAPSARVRRSGTVEMVPAVSLVPGDVLLLESGNVVPADARLIDVARFTVEEAALTGESEPVHKMTANVPLGAAVADQRNMAFQGTAVAGGRATAVVTATGMRTELGRIASLLQDEAVVRTPLQRRLGVFGRQLAFAALALCAVILAVGLARGEPPVLMFMTALSIAVAAIPEALPAVVTMSLAFGARRLVRRNALIRRLPAVETLGSVTVICTDKTGTLTENRMRVEWTSASPVEFLHALTLCNDAEADVGDPTETALLDFAAERGVDRAALRRDHPRVDEVPFTAERSRMTTIHRARDGSVVSYTKGAPERVLPRCVHHLTEEGVGRLDRDAAAAEAHAMAGGGLRVLAVSMRRFDVAPSDAALAEEDQTFIGFVGLVDPPRAEARESVALCRRAGIRVVMITGDHAATAFAIASRLGIADDESQVMRGVELRELSPEALETRIESIRVYARVAPEDKIGIVKALQARGEIVAMTGDGVNDAPALRRADIGVAMGRGGTDIAREASAMVLLDDNFATIAQAVREGRRVYDNIRKFIRYTLAGNGGEIWPLLLAPLFGLPLPFLPIQILWINLVTDGLPGLALAAENSEPELMQRPPRPPAEGVFARGLWQHVVWASALIGALTLATQALWFHRGAETWRTMTFTVITFAQMGHVLAIRSERTSLMQLGVFSNRPLAAAVALTMALQLAVIYVPALQQVFRTTALSPTELASAVGIALIVPIAVELEKWRGRATHTT